MLTVLRSITQVLSKSDDMQQTMQEIVTLVRTAMDTEACTVFILDRKRREYVLIATEGLVLREHDPWKLRFGQSKGIVGFVGVKEEPINLENAREHPNYFSSPLVDEKQYTAYLGVPIIHARRLTGIITVQQSEARRYNESEEAFLVTVSAQLGAVIAHAEMTGALNKWLQKRPSRAKDQMIKGIGAVAGVGIGDAVVVYSPADLAAVPDKQTDDIEAEKAAFDKALKTTLSQLRTITDRMRTLLPGDQHNIFETYSQLLQSQGFQELVIAEIDQGCWAPAAVRKVITQMVNEFEAMTDPYLKERATDMRDMGLRLLAALQAETTKLSDYPAQTVLIGEEVPASILAEIPRDQLAGIVSLTGSTNSHLAILARALGVPTVMGAQEVNLGDMSEKPMIVDGYTGHVYIKPTVATRKKYEGLLTEELELDASLEELRELPAQTLDGHIVSLYVDTGLAVDASLSLSVGADGVGLFRTEVPFMVHDRFPAEEEQRVVYHQILKGFNPKPVFLRTLDIGGDKSLPYFPIKEKNPFLGWRGIRVTLDHPELFIVQLRAMLRASEGLDNLHIMFPMLTSMHEIDELKTLLKQAYDEVVEEGAIIKMPKMGVMIEVPSAVYQARWIARQVDFVSVGSNDLTQYMLAVDRNNARVASLYDSLHPAVLQALLHVVESVHSEGKSVSLCGEMSSDPISMVLLLAMGFDALSMNAISLPRMKWVIRNFSLRQAREVLRDVLIMDNPKQIRSHVANALMQANLGGLIRAGKT